MLRLNVDDGGALTRAEAALREIEKEIPKGIKADLRDAFKKAAREAKANVGGGRHLRPAIRGGVRTEGGGFERSLVADKTWGYDLPAAVNASNSYMVGSTRQSYSGGWEHPLFGLRRSLRGERLWFNQQSPSPNWFTSAVENLPLNLGEKWVDLLDEAADYVASRV